MPTIHDAAWKFIDGEELVPDTAVGVLLDYIHLLTVENKTTVEHFDAYLKTRSVEEDEDTWEEFHPDMDDITIGDEVRFDHLDDHKEGIIQGEHQHNGYWHFQIVDREGHNHPDVHMHHRITHYRKRT